MWRQMKSEEIDFSRVLLIISTTLFCACLPFSSFCVYSVHCGEWPSWSLLVFGWIVAFNGWPYSTWFANPLLIASWGFGFSRMGLIAFGLSSWALFLAVSFAKTEKIITNEGGAANPIMSFELGYWLWIASMFFSTLSAAVESWDQIAGRRKPPKIP